MSEKEYVPSKDPKWLQCIELKALGGMTNEQIFAEVGVSKTTFYDWAGKKEFTDAVLASSMAKFKSLLPKAIKTIEECLCSSNQKVRIEAAKLLLDRVFPPEQSDIKDPVQVNIQVNYV